MSYKTPILLLFSFLFFSAASFAAIPLEQVPVQKEDTASQKIIKKIEQKIAKKFAKDRDSKNPNINGLLSFIFGIGTFVIFPPLAVPAVILGIISLSKGEPNQWMPIVGLITGGLMLLLLIAVLVFFFIVRP